MALFMHLYSIVAVTSCSHLRGIISFPDGEVTEYPLQQEVGNEMPVAVDMVRIFLLDITGKESS